MTLSQSIATYEKIGIKMIPARSLDTCNHQTTSKFWIDGLQFKPATINLGDEFIAVVPKASKELCPQIQPIGTVWAANYHSPLENP